MNSLVRDTAKPYCDGERQRVRFKSPVITDITGQSLPVLWTCARILFIPLSVPPHKLEAELVHQLRRGHSAELLLLKRKSELEEIQLKLKNWPVISDYSGL